jgi:mono/diheme cytochrome c family protein
MTMPCFVSAAHQRTSLPEGLRLRWLISHCLAALLVATLAACGGGGSGSSGGGDVIPGFKPPPAPVAGPDSFLLFPNPQKQADGSLQVDSLDYAKAYYEAVDPNNQRDTLAKFKALNNFGVTGPGIVEESVIVGDQRDLGYGRKMTARQNADGSLAFVVDNFLVGGYGGYSPLNLEAAITGATQWHLGTNGIEFSPGPGGTVNFAKFYTFDPATGNRLMTISLDGRGSKAMPTVCISCHGGRGDPLTPPDASGKRLFAKVMNSFSQARGDVGAQLHPFEPASFDFSTLPGFSRALQESKIKTINKIVLCSMALPNGSAASPFPEDACRAANRASNGGVATINEYQGTAATHLKDMYGGDGLPLNATAAVDTYVPADWQANGQSTLYLNTQAQACRVCHLLRGTGNQSDISFDTFTKFNSFADRIKAHVLDRGNMPLAKLIADKYWSTPAINGPMATFLATKGYVDAAQRPGRPIADPGLSRVVKQLSTSLSSSMSLYSTNYQWAILSGPAGATLSSATAANPTFTAAAAGTYVIQLITGSAAIQTVTTSAPGAYGGQVVTASGPGVSLPASMTLVVDPALAYEPSALRFSDIKAILQTGGGGCTTCHQAGGNGTVTPPIWYTSYDRAGTGNGADATNDHWFYTELRGRVNFTDIVASAILRKPSGNHHNGQQRPGFDTSLTPGQAGRVDYDKILGWILNGAPE